MNYDIEDLNLLESEEADQLGGCTVTCTVTCVGSTCSLTGV
ncbi:hypothetical protein [Streptomyces globisporus]